MDNINRRGWLASLVGMCGLPAVCTATEPVGYQLRSLIIVNNLHYLWTTGSPQAMLNKSVKHLVKVYGDRLKIDSAVIEQWRETNGGEWVVIEDQTDCARAMSLFYKDKYHE